MSIPTTATLNLFQGSGGSLHESYSHMLNRIQPARMRRQKFMKISSFTSTPNPSARFCSTKFGISARGTRWTLMSSFSSPPPSPDLAHAMGSHQRERLRQHARRRKKLAKPLDALGGEARFLLQLLDGGALGRRVWFLIANEASGKLDAAAIAAAPRLVDQDHLPLISARITTALMLFARLAYSHLSRLRARTNLPSHITWGGGRSSRFIAGSACQEFGGVRCRTREMLGKHHFQRVRLAAQMPSQPVAGAFADVLDGAPPWPHPRYRSSVTLRVASSATISARRSARDR